MRNFVADVQIFNRFLADNYVTAVAEIPDVHATFLSMCEYAQHLNGDAPTDLKNWFFALGAMVSDEGTPTIVRMKLRNNGPIEDIAYRGHLLSRKKLFDDYSNGLSKFVDNYRQQTPHVAPPVSFDELASVNAWARNLEQQNELLREQNDLLLTVMEANTDRFRFLRNSSHRQLLDYLAKNGITPSLEAYVKQWAPENAPVVTFDAAGNFAAFVYDRVKDEVVDRPLPNWATGFTLFKNSRAVRPVDPNLTVETEPDAYRHKYRLEAKAKRTQERHFRQPNPYDRNGDRSDRSLPRSKSSAYNLNNTF